MLTRRSIVNSPKLKIEKEIEAEWNEPTRQKLVEFWGKRRFSFSPSHEAHLSANRGSLIGNAISFDMSRLLTELRIEPVAPKKILLSMTVDTRLQSITEWNRAFWDLEMATCESFIKTGDLLENQWAEFSKGDRKASWTWVLTLTLGGRRKPKRSFEKNAYPMNSKYRTIRAMVDPTIKLTQKEAMEELPSFQPFFEDPHLPELIKEMEDRRQYPTENDQICDFLTCIEAYWIDGHKDPAVVKALIQDKQAIASASLEQVRLMLSFCYFAEKWANATLVLMSNGTIKAILARLRVLYEELYPSQ